METLTVIIPAYNAEKYLREAVGSVKAQNWAGKMELIIVDDGSLDNTAAFATELGAMVIKQSHTGAASARNAGIANAKGQLILFLDADDMLAKGALAALYAPIKNNPDLMAVFGMAEDFISPELTLEQTTDFTPKIGRYGGVLPGCALIRRKTFETVGLFDETLKSGETVDWQIKLRNAGLKTLMLETLTLYRRHHLTNTGRLNKNAGFSNYAAAIRKNMRAK